MSVSVPARLKERFDAIERLEKGRALPSPWRSNGSFAVGGLTDVGFVDSSDLVICLSSTGRGLFDCISGSRVARDDDPEFEFDTGNLTVEGIGPLAGTAIRTAGMYGGGLASGTHDGWAVEPHPFAFPEQVLIVSPPGQTMLWTAKGEEMHLTKLADYEIRAFGFSPTGRSFVLATSSDLLIFVRD
jgi:hypothetical protein